MNLYMKNRYLKISILKWRGEKEMNNVCDSCTDKCTYPMCTFYINAETILGLQSSPSF